MTTASQSGFTNMLGSVPANISDGNTSTGWYFDLYADNTGKIIQFDTGGWFDGSTLGRSHIVTPSRYLIGAGGFAMQLSADGTNWFNMPDNTGSITLGYANDVTTNFTPWPDGTNFRYIRFIGTGGAYDLPAWTKAHGYLSYLTFFTTMEFLTASGAALTVVGGSNPAPPAGVPDTDDGAANVPDPPPDSHVPARTTTSYLTVLRSDPGDIRVTSVVEQVMRSDPGDIRVTSVQMSVMYPLTASLQLASDLIDDSTLTGKVTLGVPRAWSANMRDDSTLTAKLTVTPPALLSAHLTDDAVLDVYTSLDTTFGQYTTYINGR